MDSRRRNGLLALAVLLVAAAALFYYQARSNPPGPTTAFAPAESADESVAPADTLIDPPADLAAAPAAGETADQGIETSIDTDDSATETAAAVEPPPSESEAPVAPGAEVALTEPTTEEIAEDAADAIPPPLAVPTFDIVRVEPSGDTVIAGQAEPNALVEIMDGADVIASVEANETGEWAIALEEPLEAGTHDLAISTTSEDESVVTLSDERVTVSVPAESSENALVVLNSPDAPSTVLQVPDTAQDVAAAEGPDAAMAEPGSTASDAGGAEVVAAAEPGQTEAVPGSSEPAPIDVAEGAEPATEGPAAGETAVASGDVPAGSPTESLAPAETGEAPVAEAPSDVSPSEGPSAPQAGEAGESAPTEQEVAVAAAPAEPESPATGGDTGTADVTGVPAAAQENVAVAAVEEPTMQQAPEVAATTEGASETSVDEPAGEAEVAAAPVEEPAPPPPPPAVVVAAVEADTDGSLYIAGTATTGETVRVYLDGEYIGDATPSPSGTWLIETVVDLPAGEYLVRADQIGSDGAVVARYEVPFDREVEVAVLKPTGATGSTATATVAGAMPEMETVIIKRGDNLWAIARSTWGKGIRWSTIYQANTDQIRNPNRIYPGQVFVMPKGDATWEN